MSREVAVVAQHKVKRLLQTDLRHLCHISVETLVSVAFQSKRNAIKCRVGRKELNFSSILTAFILSTGTDLLILEGQTGPAHNNTGVARSIFPRQRETHLFGMTVAQGLIVPPVRVLRLSHWQTHLVSCHLRLILHRLDMFPVQKDLRAAQFPLNVLRRPVRSCETSNYENKVEMSLRGLCAITRQSLTI